MLGYDVDPRQLLTAETKVYGLISGPSLLRQSLVAQFESMWYVRNTYDEFIMTLPRQTSNGALRSRKPQSKDSRDPHLNEGIIMIEVDDILEGGPEIHRKRIGVLYEKWKCGTQKRALGNVENMEA